MLLTGWYRTLITDFITPFIVFKVHSIPWSGNSPWKLHYSIIYLLQIFTYYILVQLLFPYFNNSIPWCSYYKPLSGLESCNICDNIVMSNWERLRTLPRGLISGPHFLLVLNFLCKTKRKKKREKSEKKILTERWALSSMTVFQVVKTKKKLPSDKQKLPPFDGWLIIISWFISFHHTKRLSCFELT